MDPFHQLCLPDLGLDILRSCIGIFCRTEPGTGRSTFVAFDFMHGGKGPKVAMEPQERIDQVLRHANENGTVVSTGACAHLIYLSSTARWWTNALHSVNKQLITHETKLQTEMDNTQITTETVFQNINKGLHSIAAHMHRYQSELKSLEGAVRDLSTHYDSLESTAGRENEANTQKSEENTRGFKQILSQVEACHELANELEKKTQNILALVRCLFTVKARVMCSYSFPG